MRLEWNDMDLVAEVFALDKAKSFGFEVVRVSEWADNVTRYIDLNGELTTSMADAKKLVTGEIDLTPPGEVTISYISNVVSTEIGEIITRLLDFVQIS